MCSSDLSNATTSAAGLMSAADKTKLNGIATGATTKAVSQKAKWNAAADGAWAVSGLTVGCPLFIIHEKKSQSGKRAARYAPRRAASAARTAATITR